MNKTELVNKFTRGFNKMKFKVNQHSPEILIVLGTAGVIGGTILACMATRKVDGVLEEAAEKIEDIHEYVNEIGYSDDYTEKDEKRALAKVYCRTGLEFVRLYAPAVVTTTVGLTCMITSNKILRDRNLALAAAYASVDKGFKEYRKRVVERFGEEMDNELRYDIKSRKVEETVVDENGNETVIEKEVKCVAEDILSNEFSKFFDESCKGWSKNAEYNMTFLLQVQAFANRKLQAEGYLYLNEVYEMLGIQKTKAGQIAGWVWDENNPTYIDFGIFNIYREKNRDFVNGYEPVILLEFNVQGNILDKM